jgi:hypothetical protein
VQLLTGIGQRSSHGLIFRKTNYPELAEITATVAEERPDQL